jgi:hypothetical protein
MARPLILKEKKEIGVKKEGTGFNMKSANPKPRYLKSIELAVKEIAVSYERK